MSTEPQPQESNILEVDFKAKDNNAKHHTAELSTEALIVRRGQHFNIGLKLKRPYNPEAHHLTFTASTGEHGGEDRGTKSVFGIPDFVKRSPEAKAVWRAQIDQIESVHSVVITITPPADAPIGKYSLFLNYLGEDKELGAVVVLFNPWCTEDSVYMEKEEEIQEYVMNENGIIYKGSGNYIISLNWDFGQFEDEMVEIVLTILRVSPDHLKDAAKDDSNRCDPVYVGRVISAMINSHGDKGVLMGRWGGKYIGGHPPSHWSGSYPILKRWYTIGCHPVKFGQCWVFAGVMCSVMRLLGIPCRVVTNYESAHDTNKNLSVDVYHPDYGVRERPSKDSVWNYHVWVEGWMRRPDLPPGLDGWQVLDPTPQELSDGVYCCGPAPVTAVLNGHTDVEYDVPFVFAEVNADCIDWLVKKDGSKQKIWSDIKRVGQNISTKSVGSKKRWNITSRYKHREGTEKERTVFKYAMTRDFSEEDEEKDKETDKPEETESPATTENGSGENGAVTSETEEPAPELPKVSLKFEEVSKPVSGKDVKLNLVLHNEATEPRSLSINIQVTAKNYNGTSHSGIQSELKKETLLPDQDLRVPVLVPFSQYWEAMLDSDVMKVSAIVSDTDNDSEVYLAESDVVLVDPPIEVKMKKEAWLYRPASLEIAFSNPVPYTLKNCTLTLSGSGLWRTEREISLPNLGPERRVRVKMPVIPYKTGQKTMTVDFDCSHFRDIKKSLSIEVKEK